MLHGDLVELASWEQTMTAKHPETDALHWHRQDPEWTCTGLSLPMTQLSSTTASTAENIFHAVTNAFLQHLGDKAGHIRCDGHGAEDGSLFCALAYFFDHFSHDALLKEFPKPREPIDTPEKLIALGKLAPSELKPSNYLRWLVALIGDLHQPLHWLREHSYGGKIKVQFRDQQYTLLSLWEELIPQHLPPPKSPAQLQKHYQEQSPAWWDKMPPELFREWARDTAQRVCQDVYSSIKSNNTDGSAGIDSPFKLEEDVFLRWVRLAQEFTTLGGERLAFILNDILEHKRHKVAHREGRGRFHRRKSWTRSLAINGLISVVVVPLLLSMLCLHAQTGHGSFLGFMTHLKI